MLQQMRQMKMAIFWIVAVTFLVGFVLFGGLDAPQMGQGQDQNTIAVVNGDDIPYEAYSRWYSQMVESEGRGRDLMVADYERLDSQAWDNLLTEVLVAQEAKKLQIQVPDDEIVGILTQNPPQFVRERFHNDKGEFDESAFQRAVNDPSYPWGNDERYLRAVLPSLKLQQMVRAQATVSEAEVRREFARRTQRTKVQYAGVEWPSIELPGFAPTESDLRAAYEAHPERFQRGETVTLEILKVDRAPSALDEADAREDLAEIQAEAQRGIGFAELAANWSDDPSAARGGELGWTSASRLAPAVGAAAANLQPGQTSEPVRTEQAFVLVHADSARIEGGERQLHLRQLVLHVKPSPETVDSLRQRVLEVVEKAQTDFEAAARDLGVTVQKLEPVESMGFIPGVGFSKRLVDWAFAAKPGDVSGPAGTETCFVIARLVAKTPKTARPFDEVKEQARFVLEETTKKERARAQVQRVVQRHQSGMALADAARAEGLEWKDPAPAAYTEAIPGLGAANEFSAAAAALPVGATSGVIETSAGAYVLQVLSRDPFDEAKYQAERDSEYGRLVNRREYEVFDAWLADLKKRATITDRRSPRV
jgi:parvulin-like peptidyl-prolyl isomerase